MNNLSSCRLDRAMGNSSWTDLFPTCRSHYLRYEGSDHRPLLSVLDSTRKKGNHIFRFDRRLRDNAEVKSIISDIWTTFSHLPVEIRLSMCRRAIIRWCREFHQNSRKTIEDLKEQLDTTMASSTMEDTLLYELNGKLLKAYKAEEEFWKQRSRQLWLSLGDSNTGYFHAVTRGRRARNKLSVIEGKDAQPVYEEELIAKTICDYYKELFTSIPSDGSEAVRKALQPRISALMNQELIKDPTPE